MSQGKLNVCICICACACVCVCVCVCLCVCRLEEYVKLLTVRVCYTYTQTHTVLKKNCVFDNLSSNTFNLSVILLKKVVVSSIGSDTFVAQPLFIHIFPYSIWLCG